MSPFLEVLSLLHQMEEDHSIPKNLKIKIKSLTIILKDESDNLVKINKSLQLLEEISEDPNLSSFIRTQIFNISSLLESKSP